LTIYDTGLKVRDTTAVVTNLKLRVPIDIRTVAADKNLIAFSGTIACSSNKIDSITVSTGGSLSAQWAIAQRPEANQCTFALSGSNPITGPGAILYAVIHFKNTVAVNDKFTLNCSNILLNEGSPVAKVQSGIATIASLQTVEDTPNIAEVTNPESFHFFKGDKTLEQVKALLPASVQLLLSNNETVQAPVNWSTNSTPAYNKDAFGKYIFTGTIANSASYTNTNNLKASAEIYVDKDIVDVNDAFLLRAGSITYLGQQVDYLYLPGAQGQGGLMNWKQEINDWLLNRYQALLPNVPISGDYVAYKKGGTVAVLPATEIAKVSDWTDITKAADYFFPNIVIQTQSAINPLSDETIEPLADNAYRIESQKEITKTDYQYVDGVLLTIELTERYHLVFTTYGNELSGTDFVGISLPGNNHSLKLYPNPVKEVLNINNGQAKIEGISVADAGGRLITKTLPDKSVYQLVTGNWKPGIYIVTIETKSGISRHKVVKTE
jgi:hypothetical protein